jgi:hypothetical protein
MDGSDALAAGRSTPRVNLGFRRRGRKQESLGAALGITGADRRSRQRRVRENVEAGGYRRRANG